MGRLIPLVVALLSPLTASATPPDFDRTVAPMLVQRCSGCHSGAEPKGDFDITRKANVVPADVWAKVDADEMPPMKPLTADEKAVLKAWIDGGAAWGTDPIRTRAEAKDWWAFQPLKANPDRKGGGGVRQPD